MRYNYCFLSFILMIQLSIMDQFDQLNNSDISSKDKMTQIETLLNQHKGTEGIGDIYHEAAKTFYRQDLTKALMWQREAVRNFRLSHDKNLLAKGLYNLGIFSGRMRDYNTAERSYKELISFKNEDNREGKAFTALGTLSMDDGDYYQAFLYFKEAERILNAKDVTGSSLLKNKLQEITLYSEMGTLENIQKIEKLFDSVDSLALVLGSTIRSLDKYDILSRKSYVADDLKDYKKSIINRLEALDLAITISDSSRIADSYNNLAVSYLKSKQNDKVLSALNKVFIYSKDPEYVGPAYNNMGDFYMLKNDFDNALKLYQESINAYFPVGYLDSKEDLDEIIKKCENKEDLITAFMSKVELYRLKYDQNKEDKWLNKLLHDVLVADRLLALIRSESFENTSKLFWREKANKVYSRGINAAFLLNDLSKYLYFMEKNKAVLLLENLSERQARQIAGVPDEISQKGIILMRESRKTDKSNMDNYLIYEQFLDSIKRAFPVYNKLRQQLPVLNLNDIKSNLLKTGEIGILQYFVSDQSVYGLFLSKDESRMFEISDGNQLHKLVDSLKIMCSKPFKNERDIRNYSRLAYQVKKTIIPDYATLNKQLLIVADGFLQNLPFDALVNKKDETNVVDHFLVNFHEISYAYSLSHLLANNSVSRENSSGFLGFAPVEFDNRNLKKLPFSKKEVQSSNKLFHGDLFLEDRATKKEFLDHVGKYKVVHLSTHASINNNEGSWISFRNEKLLENEIYSTEIDAELIVLSACNTSLGVMAAGEGVMSLARAFFSSGAGSVLSTLWSVNDQTASQIIVDFYKSILDQKSKSAALTAAKRNYLAKSVGTQVSPYFWSSFILIGETGVVKEIIPESNLYWKVGLAMIILLIAFIFFLKKRYPVSS